MQVLNYLLGYSNLKIYQDTDMFNFSLDSVLLPNFVTIRKGCKSILDIGTGNAVIPIILSTKTQAHIDGVELQEEVYNLGVKSVSYNHLEHQISLFNENIKQYKDRIESDSYDIITCNPPFFKVHDLSKLNESPYKVLARHEVTLNLDDIFSISKKLLKNNGVIALVHRPERVLDILESMRKYNIEPKRIQFVYPKMDENANIVLIEGSKNGKPGLKVLPPLYTHMENGDYTPQIEKYFVS